MKSSQISFRRRIAGLVALIAVIAVGVWMLLHWQAVNDWWKLRGYTPPSAIAALASDDTMTTQARHDFYVNHPALEGKSEFNQHCSSNSEHTIVLGCYVGNQNGIYLLQVSDLRLNGVEQVTAAHEMLHAAYDRLNSSDKKRVDAMLLDYYRHGLNDPRIEANLKIYQKTEPGNVVNEMHSIFGTEIAKLPAPLEQYYKRYFTDRAKIAAYAQSYQAEFTSRQAAVKAYDNQLSGLKQQIQAAESDLKQRQTQLTSMQAQMNEERSDGNIGSYNQNVEAYNSQVDSYNAEVQSLKELINEYNAIVNERNSVVLQEQDLAQAIDSHAPEAVAPK